MDRDSVDVRAVLRWAQRGQATSCCVRAWRESRGSKGVFVLLSQVSRRDAVGWYCAGSPIAICAQESR